MSRLLLASAVGLFSLVGCGGGGGSGGVGGGIGSSGSGNGSGGGGGDLPDQGCTKAPVASGIVRTSVTPITVKSNALVVMNMKHKLDIDPVEDGCVTNFTFSIRLHPQGCDLSGKFTTSLNDNVAHLSHLSFKADSFCENFLDKDEGSYSVFNSTLGGKSVSRAEVGIWVGGLPSDVPGDQQKSACMRSTTLTFPDADIHMIAGDKELVVNLKDFVITGDLMSAGDTEEACPAKVGCPAPYHNGGALTCYGTTYCSDTYTFANGVCSK